MEESLKLWLIEQYVEHQNILYILPHARMEYLILSVQYSCVIIVLWFIGQFLWESSSRIFIFIWALLFSKYVYDFIDLYLDSVVLTDKGITIVKIDKWFKYKTDFFERKNIITISHTQSWFMDKLFNQWSITISLDHDSDYYIKNISKPNSQVSILNTYKFDALSRIKKIEEEVKQEAANQPDKFEILVDTLSEVIGSYMKHGNHDNDR